MSSYIDVKNLIISNINANGQREITGPILQDVLLEMLENSLEGDTKNKEYVDSEIDDIPIEKGTGKNSIIQLSRTSAENKAISENAVALGSLNIAGTKAYKWSTINFNTKTITLVDTPSDISAGDRLSLINKNHYDDCCEVVSVSGKNIVVDFLPFTVIESDSSKDAQTIFVVSKPNVGNVDLGQCAFAEGGNNMATQRFSHAEGYGTKAIGQYSHAEGRRTEAVYAAHAEGEQTIASNQNAHSEGYNTTASGLRAHAEGDHTEASNHAAHSEGARTIASGVGSHVEGIDSKATNRASHAEGLWTKTSNEAEHAQGKYNVSNTGTIHSIGIGTSDLLRKNAVEVMQNGDVYVKGVGGYDGTNPANSKDIATILSTVDTSDTNKFIVEKDLEVNGKIYLKTTVAAGYNTTASGEYSHTEGENTKAYAKYSHSEGYGSIANGNASHAEGYSTVTNNRAELTIGHFNKSNKATDTYPDAGNTTFSIGIGTSDTDRKNAIEVMQNGDVYINGIGNYQGTSISSATPLANFINSVNDKVSELENNICETLEFTMTEEPAIISGSTQEGTYKLIETEEQKSHNLPIFVKMINREISHVHLRLVEIRDNKMEAYYEAIGNYTIKENTEEAEYGAIYGTSNVEGNSAFSIFIAFTKNGLEFPGVDASTQSPAFVAIIVLAMEDTVNSLQDTVNSLQSKDTELTNTITALEARIVELEKIISSLGLSGESM